MEILDVFHFKACLWNSAAGVEEGSWGQGGVKDVSSRVHAGSVGNPMPLEPTLIKEFDRTKTNDKI